MASAGCRPGETNALFLAGRTLADLPGSWQAQTSLQAEPLTGDKAQTRNLDGDRLAALQVSNTGSQPLWLRLDSSGYPQSAPQPGGNVTGIERTIFDTGGSRNRCHHCAAANWYSSSWR